MCHRLNTIWVINSICIDTDSILKYFDRTDILPHVCVISCIRRWKSKRPQCYSRFHTSWIFWGVGGATKNPWTIIVCIWEVSRLSQLLGTHENLKQRTGRQELGQLTYGINVFQHLEDGGEFNNVRHGVLTLKHMMHFRLFVICLFIVSVASAVEITKLCLLKLFPVCSVQCRLQTSVFMEFNLDFKSPYIWGH